MGDRGSLGRNFWLFAIGRFISQLGWAVQEVALPLYVLDKTHSGGMMSLFVLADVIPSLIVMPFAGVVGDRYNRKRLMVWFDVLRGVLLFAVIAFNFLGIYQLLAIQVIMAVMGTFFGAATSAMFPDLVKPEELEKANSTVSSFSIIARLIGPALGGLIYAFGGIKIALFINATSFFGSGLFEAFIHYEWETREIESMGEVIRDIREGLAFLRSSRYLMVLMGFALFMNAVGQPFGAVIMPYAFREVLKFTSQQFGLLESFFMGGMLLGNLIVAVKLGKNAGRFFFKALAFNGTMILVFIWVISPWAGLSRDVAFMTLAGVGVLWGVSNAIINVPLNAKIQRAVPTELRSRVFSALALLINLSTPLGLVAVGPLLDRYAAWLVSLGIWIIQAVVVFYYWYRYRKVLLENVGDVSTKK
ncbi:major facilitator superfamily permease 1 [Thermococcus cleftensis]|uniref:Major facilitator superfamily permease 1 n=1 Tax=Thermococcus cleftensis (strain DSM 27260 / KACC 17922 / CL1) TaxID=163003 RepID=I3ZRG0_THECF|nr:MFS transporter [Thermococcus cleftensis]AFL94294.1 major facilitator superfamily permease 1 [Thermococcus cleftensis]